MRPPTSSLRTLTSALAASLRSPVAWEAGGGGLSSVSARAASSTAMRPSSSRPPKARLPAALHSGSVDVPEGVTVRLDGDTLSLTGPLGTSTTSLSRLDGRGDGAVRVAPDGRAIEVASVSKPFFGTLTSLLRSKVEVRIERAWAEQRKRSPSLSRSLAQPSPSPFFSRSS